MLEPGGTVLLSELGMERCWQLAAVGGNICTHSLPLLGSPETQLLRDKMQMCTRVWVHSR